MIEHFEHSPLLNAISRHASVSPDKVAIIGVNGEKCTYSDLLFNIKRAATYLSGCGICKGERILLSALKEIEFVYFYFGAHLLGAINVVVDSKNSQEHIDYIASITEPSIAIGVDAAGVRSVHYEGLILPESPDSFAIKALDTETADIMFTSGTTGNPKGVLLSHFNIYSSANNINSFIGNSSDDVELLGLPLCHSFGLGRLRCTFITGATIVFQNGFANLRAVFERFEKYSVTGFGMVPSVWAYIKRLSGDRIGRYANQIRYIEIGSAAMPIEDKKKLCELFPHTRICMHYGLTEASRAVFMEFHENESNLDVTGKPTAGNVDIKILSSNGDFAENQQEGEICVSGDMVIKSYYRPEDNKDAFIKGYFRTGDYGYIDNDGNLHIVGRTKEMINVGGKKVSPIEIEDRLAEIGVGESMCVAIPDPDGILGEVPKVFLVKNTFTMTVDEIREKLKQVLEVYKTPRVFEVVDSIPKTESGKKKRILK